MESQSANYGREKRSAGLGLGADSPSIGCRVDLVSSISNGCQAWWRDSEFRRWAPMRPMQAPCEPHRKMPPNPPKPTDPADLLGLDELEQRHDASQSLPLLTLQIPDEPCTFSSWKTSPSTPNPFYRSICPDTRPGQSLRSHGG